MMPVEQLALLNQLPENIRQAVLRVLLAALAILIIWGSRRLITWLLVKPLGWVAARNKGDLDTLLIDTLVRPTRLIVTAVGLVVAAQLLLVSNSVNVVIQAISRTLLIVAVFMILARLVDVFAPNSARLYRLTGMNVEERLLPFARTAAKLVIIALGIVIVVQEWGYDVSGLVAGLGLFGLAFSLAAKDTAENLFGFTTIVGDRPFHAGEFIKTPDVEGTVEYVGVRSTRIRQLNQALVTVPNSKLAQSAILNWSRLSRRWYDTTIGISYAASSDDIRDILQSREQVEKESILVHFVEFGSSSLNILVRAYIGLPDWAEFTAEKEIIHLAIIDAIAELGLRMAFPSQSIYVEHIPRFFEAGPPAPPETPPPGVSEGERRTYPVMADEPDEHDEKP